MNWISTGVGFLFAAAAFYACAKAMDAFQRAEHAAQRLRSMVARLTALEADHESLYTQHRKLAGKFHAAKWLQEQQAEEPDGYVREVTGQPPQIANICENYQRAQVEGPQSPAAKCECLFCVRSRDERAALRAALRDKAPAARVARKSDGEE